jgi:hypothetical protein
MALLLVEEGNVFESRTLLLACFSVLLSRRQPAELLSVRSRSIPRVFTHPGLLFPPSTDVFGTAVHVVSADFSSSALLSRPLIFFLSSFSLFRSPFARTTLSHSRRLY